MLRSWINPSRRTSLEHHLTPSREPLALSSAVLVSHSLRFAFLVNLPLSVRIASRAHSMVKHKFVMQKWLFSSSGVKKCFCGKTLKSWGCRMRGLRNKSGISWISFFANGLCASRIRTRATFNANFWVTSRTAGTALFASQLHSTIYLPSNDYQRLIMFILWPLIWLSTWVAFSVVGTFFFRENSRHKISWVMASGSRFESFVQENALQLTESSTMSLIFISRMANSDERLLLLWQITEQQFGMLLLINVNALEGWACCGLH